MQQKPFPGVKSNTRFSSDIMRTPNRPLILLHVPKAAGSTVREHLKVWFPDAKHIQFTAPEFWDKMSDDEIAGYDILTGHIGFRFVERVPNAILITFLREPLARAVSQYYYHRNNLGTFKEDKVTFGDYLRSNISGFREVLDNGIVWQFAWDQYLRCRDTGRFSDADTLYRTAIENIQKVHFVGFQETMEADLYRLADFLGCGKNATFIPPQNATIAKPLAPDVSEKDKAYFEQIARLDVHFFEEVRGMTKAIASLQPNIRKI